MVATDDANPSKQDSSTVIIDVDIDSSDPVFTQPPGNNILFETIDENDPTGTILNTVVAVDGDRKVAFYELAHM